MPVFRTGKLERPILAAGLVASVGGQTYVQFNGQNKFSDVSSNKLHRMSSSIAGPFGDPPDLLTGDCGRFLTVRH